MTDWRGSGPSSFVYPDHMEVETVMFAHEIASEQDLWNIVVACVVGLVVSWVYIFVGPGGDV